MITSTTESDQAFENEEMEEDEKNKVRLSASVSPSKVILKPERGFDRVMSPPNLNLDINPPTSPVVSGGWSFDSDEDSWNSCDTSRYTSPPSSESRSELTKLTNTD